MNNTKKAQLAMSVVVIVLIIFMMVLAARFIEVEKKGEIGKKQVVTLKSFDVAEKTRNYIELSAKYSVFDALDIYGCPVPESSRAEFEEEFEEGGVVHENLALRLYSHYESQYKNQLRLFNVFLPFSPLYEFKLETINFAPYEGKQGEYLLYKLSFDDEISCSEYASLEGYPNAHFKVKNNKCYKRIWFYSSSRTNTFDVPYSAEPNYLLDLPTSSFGSFSALSACGNDQGIYEDSSCWKEYCGSGVFANQEGCPSGSFNFVISGQTKELGVDTVPSDAYNYFKIQVDPTDISMNFHTSFNSDFEVDTLCSEYKLARPK